MPSVNNQNKSTDQLLEQYKLYVEMADRVSSRRIESSKFYTALLTGLIALLSIATIPASYQKVIIAAVATLGIALCFVWTINIRSYRDLNSLKFKVIHEMEEDLPFQCYAREWEILKREASKRSYLRLTRIEQYVPLLLLIPYLLLLAYAFWL